MAYAAAVSLLQILKQLQLSDQSSNILYPKSQIQLLYDEVRFLKYFLKANSEFESDFESQIRDAIYEAEDIVESHVSNPSESEPQSFSEKLQKVVLKLMGSIAQGMEKFANHEDDRQKSSSLQTEGRSSSLPANNPFYGRYDDMNQLMYRLTGSASSLEVVPVFGIHGIGKTTLVQYVYNDSVIANHFEIRAWVMLSPEYQKRDVLLELLRSMKKLSDEMSHETDDLLAKHVNKCLNGKDYLVVLDDVPDVEVWKDFKELFPDHNNGSRVMLTTGNVEVADFAVTNGLPHRLELLDKDVSWRLLCEIVFGDESSPPEHEEITKDIAVNCRGLPLAIVTIGRLLSWASNAEWKRVASSINNCRNHVELMDVVVSLSYKYLPQHLKACLLYLGIFPYSYEIPVSKLIQLWIAEGFLEPTLPQSSEESPQSSEESSQSSEESSQSSKRSPPSLEEMAEDYLLQLINRSLVSVCQRRFNGRIKTCRIDQAFRDFIMTKAEEEKFFHVINKDTNGFLDDTDRNKRRLCIHKNISFGNKDALKYNKNALVSTARSLLFTGPRHECPLWGWLDFKMLRVLDALKIRFYSFPSQILNLVRLRYLALSYNGELPASVCKLTNLHFLIILRYLSMKHSGTPSYLPVQIWNMKELRHLQFLGNDLPDPATAAGNLENLLTLTDVSAHSCTARILARIPNLKKLGILIGLSSSEDAAETFSFFNHLHILKRLESFKCVVMHPELGDDLGSPGTGFPFVASSFVFPSTLRKITLSGCGLPWKHMTVFGSLPNLEVLKLRSYAFQGPEWETIEGEFCRLSFLLLEGMDVKFWITDSSHFPSLRYLIIRHCYNLQEIPLEIGDIATLEMIELVDCSRTAVRSALEIQQDQLDFGDEEIQVSLHSSWDD